MLSLLIKRWTFKFISPIFAMFLDVGALFRELWCELSSSIEPTWYNTAVASEGEEFLKKFNNLYKLKKY